MTVIQLDRRALSQIATPERVTRLAAFGDFAPLAHSASLARASPVTTSRITIVAGDFVHVRRAADRVGSDRPVAVTTPIVVAPLSLSLTTMTVQQFHRSADSLRTSQVHARLVAFSDIAPLAAVGLAALVLVTGFRTTPCTCVSTTAGATAIASVSVLDTTAFTTSRTLRHSIAVAAPSAGFSGAHPPSLEPLVSSFLTACAGSGSHTGRSSLLL